MKMKMIIKRFILKAFEANALSKVAWLLIREANKLNQTKLFQDVEQEVGWLDALPSTSTVLQFC